MIDFNNIFPAKHEVIEVDLTNSCNDVFETLKDMFDNMHKTTVSKTALKEYHIKMFSRFEITGFSREENNINPPDIYYYEGINLQPMFNLGWQCAICGDFLLRNDCYKNSPEIYEELCIKFKESDPPQEFFEWLAMHSMNEIIFGMGYAKFYYWLKENSIIIKESEQNHKSKQLQTIKLFSEYFAPEKREILSEICKMLFNSNNSPKEYAIMFSLLTQNDLLHIPDKKRVQYFKSWYVFIERTLPLRDNFEAINKHFIDVNAKGFVFDESDLDYLKLEALFEKTLKDKRII